MLNINKVLLIVVIVLVVALAGTLIWQNWLGKPSYYAVYLKTGDLYFGQLSRFPSFGLSRIYILQVNSQDSQNPVNIQKFSNIFWGPEDFMKINREEVVWYVKLKSDSQLISLIEANPNLAPSPANLPASNANPIAPNANSQPSVPGAK